MKPVSNEILLRQLNWRYATKNFDVTKKIPGADWQALEEALVLTPSSYGLQPWKFIVVTNQAIKESLVKVSWGQKQVADCSHLLVLAMKQKLGEPEIERHVKRTAEVRGVPEEALAGFRKMMIGTLTSASWQERIDYWAAHQVYIALGSFMTAAAVLGIDTCPMEGIDTNKYDEILKLKGSGYTTVVGCPAGYRAVGDKHATLPKVRYKHEDVVTRVE